MLVSYLVAFSAGMVTAFNPCGIALLPSYLAYLLSGRVHEGRWKWYIGLRTGVLMTIGFVIIFGIAGILVTMIGNSIFTIAPFASILVSLGLFIAAIFMWRGSLSFGIRIGSVLNRLEKMFARGTSGSFISYGMSYGLISLTCSLPVFLSVVAQGLSQGSGRVALLYVFYTFGMAVVITSLSIVAGVARSMVEQFIKQILPIIQKLSAVVMGAGGVYLLWYWFLGPGFPTLFIP